MELIKKTLVELLSIQGESGREGKVAKYVMQYLVQHNSSVYHDHYGNVLAERTFGEGPVLLLSAHMDTVVPFAPGRRLIWEMDTLSSSEGILGADEGRGLPFFWRSSEGWICSNQTVLLRWLLLVRKKLEG